MRSISVIIFFLYLIKFFLFFELFKLTPGLKTIKSTLLKDLLIFNAFFFFDQIFIVIIPYFVVIYIIFFKKLITERPVKPKP